MSSTPGTSQSYEEICGWILKSWDAVPKSAIINGFKKTSRNFYGTSEEEDEEADNHDEEESDGEAEDESPEDADARMKLLDIFLNEDNFASD